MRYAVYDSQNKAEFDEAKFLVETLQSKIIQPVTTYYSFWQ
jgi:hypothetical protein